jgi:hypothetical protein
MKGTPIPAFRILNHKLMTDRSKILDKTTGPEAWKRFEGAMKEIVRVPRSEIKAKLDAEDKVRRRKRTRAAKVRAFREANGQP